MPEISEKTRHQIYEYVKRDLNPSILSVAWRIILAFAIGGISSLCFCGQFGLGFTNMAIGWNQSVHQHVGATQCSIICGLLFSIAPVFVLRLISTGILFRRLIRFYSQAQIGCISAFALCMFVGGSAMTEALYLGLWISSAWGGFRILGMLVDEASLLLFPKSLYPGVNR